MTTHTAHTTTAILTNPALWGGKGSYPASRAEYEAAWEAVNGLPATASNRRLLVEHLRRSPAQAATLYVAPGLDHDRAIFRPEGRHLSDWRVWNAEKHPTRRVLIFAPWTPEMESRMEKKFQVILDIA